MSSAYLIEEDNISTMGDSLIPGMDYSISVISPDQSSPLKLQNHTTFVETTSLESSKINSVKSRQKPQQLSLEWSDVAYSVPLLRSKARKVILKGISGSVNFNEMTAIMGPSGAGKTSLMNVLAGYRCLGAGSSVTVNGLKREMKSFRKLSCYIMQDDHLVPNLSVLETMMVAAHLKLSQKLSQQDKQSQVENILEKLGLLDCKQTRVQKISGGQRKRLCIAQELVSNPPIIFLDEPTSGLDSSSSYQCLLVLKKLSLEGRTVVCTIHQPSAKLFELFDKLYMLADGYCIYNGKINNVIPFLSTNGFPCPPFHNPADFATEIASGDHENSYMALVSAVENGKVAAECSTVSISSTNDDVWLMRNDIENMKDSQKNEEDDSHGSNDPMLPENSFTIEMWTQFSVLFMRTLRTTIRDGTLTQLRLAAHIIIGILIGVIYRGIGNDGSKVLSNAGCLFFSMLFLLFASMMPTVLTFPLEMKIFRREHLNHWYSVKAYYLAKTMADIPFQLMFPLIYGTIVYWMTEQPCEISRFCIFLLICILVSLVSQSLGIIIGAATNIQNAVFLGPITAVPMLLFSGFFVHLDAIPSYLHWLSYLSYIRYAFEGSLIGIYGMSREKLNCDLKYCLYEDPAKYLEDMDIDTANMTWYFDAVGLVIFFIVIRFIGYFILKFKSSLKRELFCNNCF